MSATPDIVIGLLLLILGQVILHFLQLALPSRFLVRFSASSRWLFVLFFVPVVVEDLVNQGSSARWGGGGVFVRRGDLLAVRWARGFVIANGG